MIRLSKNILEYEFSIKKLGTPAERGFCS